jgi:hypothetical protein
VAESDRPSRAAIEAASQTLPTDFHTATLLDDAIYVIGSLGYHGTRRVGETPVFRLDLATCRMERLDVKGDAPGWLYAHRADRVGPRTICVHGGTLVTTRGADEVHEANPGACVLDLDRMLWRDAKVVQRER